MDLIEDMAQHIEAAGLTVPAVAALETMSPLSFLGSQGLLFVQPLLRPFGAGSDAWVTLLGDRRNVDRLIRRLEQGPAGKRDPSLPAASAGSIVEGP